MTIQYFVAYTGRYRSDPDTLMCPRRAGRCSITGAPIDSIERIESIEKAIEKSTGMCDVIITNFQRFEEPQNESK